jgi:DNA-binding beta-propeller fold protein YncE
MGVVRIEARRVAVGLLAACALALAAAGPAGASPRAQISVGYEPIPLSLAADVAGHVYLANPQFSKQVDRYSADGQLLAQSGDFGPAPNAFFPRGVAADPAGDLWVIDGPAEQVVELGTDGGEIRKWPAKGRALAIGAGGDVYVLEAHEVQRFSPEGTLISKWGSSGSGDGQFGEAWGIATSSSGLVYVADTYGNRIEVFNPDGTFVGKWGRYGSRPTELRLPYGIAVAPSGDVYITEASLGRVEEFTATGNFVRAWGRPGWQAGHFYTPTGIAVDPAGNVYVADAGVAYPDDGTARVQKFTAEGQFVTEWGEIPPPPPSPARITGGPSGTTAKRSALFRFVPVHRRPGLRYQCSLSGQAVPIKLRRWHFCASPKRYSNLLPGRKLFAVRGWSAQALTPAARRSWTILSGSKS